MTEENASLAEDMVMGASEPSFSHENPYTASVPVRNQAEFYGRGKIINQIAKRIEDAPGLPLLIFGRRLTGKTSLLLQISQRLQIEGRYSPVYFNLESRVSKSLADVLFDLAISISDALGIDYYEANNFDPNGDYFRQEFLPVALQKAAVAGIVLLLDELDIYEEKAEQAESGDLFSYLWNWVMAFGNVNIVCVMGKHPKEVLGEAAAAFREEDIFRLSMLGQGDAEALVRQAQRKTNMVWDDEAVKRVWELTRGQPFLIQQLCSMVWEGGGEDEDQGVVQFHYKDVEDKVKKTQKQAMTSLRWIWRGLTLAEQVVLSVASETETGGTRQQIIGRLKNGEYGLSEASVDKAIGELIASDYLLEDEENLRHALPFFRGWVARYYPFRKLKESLGQLETVKPLDEQLFQIARDYYERGDNDSACNQLNKALDVNSRNVEARMFLGRILVEQGDLGSAIEEYEEVYRYRPELAQDDLIKTLIIVAREQTEENAKLGIYDHILEIEPNHPVAREERTKILVKQGEAALFEEKYEEARWCFEQARDMKRVRWVELEIRKQELEASIQKALAHEEAGEWDEAVSLYEVLQNTAQDYESSAKRNDLPDYYLSLDALPGQRLEEKFSNAIERSRVGSLYKRALKVLKNGNNAEAQQLLLAVLEYDPLYEEAAWYFYQATTGQDVIGIQAQLETLQKEHDSAKERIDQLEEGIIAGLILERKNEKSEGGLRKIVRRKKDTESAIEHRKGDESEQKIVQLEEQITALLNMVDRKSSDYKSAQALNEENQRQVVELKELLEKEKKERLAVEQKVSGLVDEVTAGQVRLAEEFKAKEAVEKKVEAQRKEILAERANVEKERSARELVEKQNEEYLSMLDKAEDRVSQKQVDYQQTEQEVKKLEDQIAALEEKLEEEQNAHQATLSKVADLEGEISTTKIAHKEKLDDYQSASEKIEQLEDVIASVQTDLEEEKTAHQQAQNKLTRLEEELFFVKDDYKEAQESRENAEQRANTLEAEYNLLKSKYDQDLQGYQDTQKSVDQLSFTKEAWEQAIDDAENKIIRLEKRLERSRYMVLGAAAAGGVVATIIMLVIYFLIP